MPNTKRGMAQISEGDILLFYTDGITEVEQNGRPFGEKRLLELMRGNIQKYAAELLESIFEEVAEFSSNSPRSDDRTAIVLKRLAR